MAFRTRSLVRLILSNLYFIMTSIAGFVGDACYEDNWGLQPDIPEAVSMDTAHPNLPTMFVKKSE